MKFSVLALTVGVAAAFAPTPTNKRTSVVVNNDLWGPDGDKKKDGEMSKALPFVTRPKMLDGALPGDAGFE
jgi:hypothetical protein